MTKNSENHKNRFVQLTQEIETAFGHLAPDEVDKLASHFQNYQTRMIEVIRVRKNSALVMDLHEDIEFPHVAFPASIMNLLAKHDVFLAGFGQRNQKWEINYLSPPYNDFSIETLDT